MKGKKLTSKEREEKLAEDKCERRKVFKELLAHVEQGLSLESFGPLSDVSIKRYLSVYPEEFCQEELDEAKRKGKAYWEHIGRRQANGECLGNSRTWFYNMANRFGWREKLDIEAEHKGQVAINVISYATQKALQQDERDVKP